MIIAALNEKYRTNFKAYLRNSFYVDALLNKNDSNSLVINEQLKNNNIKTQFRFFQNAEHLVIPEINVKDTSDKIYELTQRNDIGSINI